MSSRNKAIIKSKFPNELSCTLCIDLLIIESTMGTKINDEHNWLGVGNVRVPSYMYMYMYRKAATVQDKMYKKLNMTN